LKERTLTVQDLLDDVQHGLDLVLIAGGEGVRKKLETPRIQKPGLALTGYTEYIHPDRVQILGNTEISYLRQLSPESTRKQTERLCSFPIVCLIVTRGLEPPACLVETAEKADIPLLRSSHGTSQFISLITSYLEDRLLPVTHVHGVLIDVFGVGILILGKSGIGKSECALDLVIRGHRLVADDVVQIKKKMPAALVGTAAEALQFRMEIRGLGIINVKDLYGISAIREKKSINLVIELCEWNDSHDYDRLGLDEHYFKILDVDLKYLKIPVRYGRNLTSIIEVAARNFLLRVMGYNSTREFHDNLLERLDSRITLDEVE
jgi:HPr kinase/phosphorylase